MERKSELIALVVDDSQLNRQILVEYLKSKDFTTIEAEDGKDALSKIEGNSPDIILLDLIMPVMDGFETMEHLKNNGNQIPIIVITAYIKENTFNRCKELGAKGFLNKPVKMHELFGTISKLIGQN
jgi:two-component system, chemotaxis family, sensor kinase CheA